MFGEGSFNRTFGDAGSRLSDKVFGNSYEKAYSSYHAASEKQSGSPSSTYPESKRQFYEASLIDDAPLESGDFIFDIIGGAAVAKQAGQLGIKGLQSVIGRATTKTLSIRTVGELGEAAVRAAYDIGPKRMVQMSGATGSPKGCCQA